MSGTAVFPEESKALDSAPDLGPGERLHSRPQDHLHTLGFSFGSQLTGHAFTTTPGPRPQSLGLLPSPQRWYPCPPGTQPLTEEEFSLGPEFKSL